MAPSPKRIKASGNSSTGIASSKPGSKSPKPRRNPTRSNVSNVVNLETNHTPSGEYDELSEKLIAENKNTQLITAPAPKRIKTTGNSPTGMASSKPGSKSPKPRRNPTRSNVSNVGNLETSDTPSGEYEELSEKLIAENKNTHLITAPSPKRIKTTGNSPTGMASSKPGSKSPKPRHNPTRSNVSNVGNLETIHTPSGEYEELSEKLIAENKNTHLITAPAPKRVSKAGNSSIGVASGSSKPGAKSSEPSRKPTGRSNVSNLELLQTCYTPPGKYDERAEQFAERLIAENLLENPSLAVEQSTPSRLLPEQDELIDFFSNLFGSSKKSSTKKSTNKKIKANKIPKTPKTHVDLDQWLEYDARPQTPPDPNKSALDKIFEKYMEDPYAPMARFLPKVEKKSPEKPLTFFSPVKERVPFSTPPVFSKSRRALGLGSPINLGPPAPSGAKKEMQLDVDVTPLHGKYLDARAYSPVSSVGKPYKLFGSSGGPLSYGSDPYFEIQNAALCSTPLASKTPSETVNRSLTFSGVPAPVATTPDLDSSTLAKRGGSYGTNTPGGIISSILFGIICFVDVRYDKEDHSEWVRRDVIGHGARAEKTFNKKVNLVIFKAGKISTYMKAKENNIPIVSLLWIHACKQVGGLVDPKLYAPSDDEQYQKNVPIEEARKRARFYARGQRFLDRLDGKLPPKPPRAPRSNKKKVVPTTEGKKRKRIDGKTIRKDPVKGTQPRKGPIKLDFNHPSTSQCADQKSAESDSDYVSETEAEGNAPKSQRRRKSAPADLGEVGQQKLTRFSSEKKNYTGFKDKQKDEDLQQTPSKSSDRSRKDLLNVLTGGFVTTDKKRRKLFDPNESVSFTHNSPGISAERSPYIKVTPSKSTRSQSTSAERPKRVQEAKQPLAAQKSLTPLMEHEELESSPNQTSSRNSLSCFVLEKKSQVPTKCQPRIAFTSISKDDMARYKGVIKKLGVFDIDTTVTKRTTHLLTTVPARRTVNLLKAIAQGCWILSLEWLIHSESNGKWKSEEPFEMKSFSEAVTACRLEKQAFGKDFSLDLFSSCGHIFVDSDVQPPRPDLVDLLKLCGGKVVRVLTKAGVVVSCRLASESLPSVPIVNPVWILDSITQNKSLPLEQYKIQT